MSGAVEVLAPCPFCGYDDIRRDDPKAPDNNGIVYCDQCGAHALSADAWNMRTHGAAVAELVEDRRQLADALAKLVCEPSKLEYREQARAALARSGGAK